MTPERMRWCLVQLCWGQRQLARIIGYSEADVRGWAQGKGWMPPIIETWLNERAQQAAATPVPAADKYGKLTR